MILSGWDGLLERADWFRRIELEYVYHFVPAAGYEPRVVDPCHIQTAGCVGDQVRPSLLRRNERPFLTIVSRILFLQRFISNIPQLNCRIESSGQEPFA